MLSQTCNVDALVNLTPADKALFLKYGFGPRITPPFGCIHHAFEHHARAQPDAVAVEEFQEQLSFADLDRQANCLASRLRSFGVIPGKRICLLVERSISMVVGILGILKAGAAYVPLDGNIVSDKTLGHALHDSQATVVVALRKFAQRVSGLEVICLDEPICNHPAEESCAKPNDLSSSDDSVYIIYTSGTTGVPKGVDVTHGNVTNLVGIEPGSLGMRRGTRVSQLMNISFDMAAWEILGSLYNGSTLCLRGKTSKQWRAVMKTVDVVVATPSMLVPHNPLDYPNIKVVAVAGEPCPKVLADAWARVATFYNCCGPTEITIVNTMQIHQPGSAVRIGGPTPNNTVYVLDDSMQPVPIGQPGLMWAGGACVTRGYMNLPEKTAERYRPDIFTADGQMMFNTGDLGRWHEGTLEHLGRIDNQVKVKGFRVELDGVSAAMETCTGVKVAAALLIDGELWGFVTPSVDVGLVKAAAAKVQPYYAVPTHILSMDHFPETTNGKTDKRALQQMAIDSLSDTASSSSSSIRSLAIKDEKLPETDVRVELPLTLAAPQPVYLADHNHSAADSGISSGSGTSTSGDLKDEISSIAKSECAWAGYQEEDLPKKTHGRFLRNIRHQVFSLYRRLFGLVFVVNMAIFISVIIKGSDAQQLGLIVVSNLFCAILMRQDYVINAFFTVFCAVPPSWPLSIRRVCARVYHIGGLHSGCAASGVVWLCLFAGQATKEMLDNRKVSIPTLAVTYVILLLLVGILVFAHPTLRSKYHDRFERTHRFLGWTATALVWCQVVLLTNDYKALDQSLGHALIRSAPFWMLMVISGSIILPWTRLRKVPVRSVVLSSHAVRLYFDYVTPITGSFTRISDNPLMEWHGFATVPEPGMKGYSLVVSKAGDWTNKQITCPPKELWVRGIPTYGVLRIVPLFRRVIFVATGSGIGPVTPCILGGNAKHRLLWTSPNVRQTFGDALVDSILARSPNAVIYDTRVHGKPDMVKLTYRLVREFDAEAVCVISNQKLTQKVVYGMMSRGIPAFGAIWDS